MATTARVRYDWESDSHDRLSIKQGEVLNILAPAENGWILAESGLKNKNF